MELLEKDGKGTALSGVTAPLARGMGVHQAAAPLTLGRWGAVRGNRIERVCSVWHVQQMECVSYKHSW